MSTSTHKKRFALWDDVSQCSIRIPSELLEKIDDACRKDLSSRSAWFVKAARKVFEEESKKS